MLENDVKFILFAHHLSVLNALEDHMCLRFSITDKKDNYSTADKPSYIRIDGGT